MSQSDGYSTDEAKRKRDTEEKSPFRKSKKTGRSPAKEKSSLEMEDFMTQIISELKEMRAEIKELRKENEEYRNEVRELKQENKSLKAEIREINEKLKCFEELEWRREKLERNEKRNNIIISGPTWSRKEDNITKEKLEEPFEDFIKKNLGVVTKIIQAKPIQKDLWQLQVESFEKKMDIMKNKNKLKNLKDSKVIITDDLTYNQREIQRKIKQRSSVERENGKRTKIGYQYLIVEGVKWMWSRERGQLVEAGLTNNPGPSNSKN